MRIIVLGGGIAGCATALAMGRRGHEVVVLERDPSGPAPEDPDECFQAGDRPGIAQYRQPHNFLGLGRRLLRDRLPDVYEALLATGATEVEQFRFIPCHLRQPEDSDLAIIACRRPVFDAALERALQAEPMVDRRPGARITGLLASAGSDPRVLGAVLDGGEEVTGDIVVDCLGRTTRVPGWLGRAGLTPPVEVMSDCGLVYYSRHFRWRDGVAAPPYASLLAGPRGDVGCLAFAVFLGDNRTFSLCIMISPGDRELRAVRHPDAFMRVAERLPGLAAWVDPGAARPITPVLPIGHLRNALRRYVRHGRAVAPGLWPVGDALTHTNPTFASGVSLALHHALTLTDALDEAADDSSLASLLEARVEEDAARRYATVSAEDRDRARLWAGHPLDPSDPGSTMALFLRSVVYRAAPGDPALLRAAVRRIDLLDSPDALTHDESLLQRAREIFGAMLEAGAVATAPSRQELVDAVSS